MSDQTIGQPKILGVGISMPVYDVAADLIGLGKNFQRKVYRLLQPQKDETVLDVASGTGTFAIVAKSLEAELTIIGIEPDTKIISVANKKANRKKLDISFIASTAQDMPFPANSFDVVNSSLAFHHMPTADKRAALKEIWRVLKPGGRFLLSDFGKSRSFWLKTSIRFGELLGFESMDYAKDNLESRIPDLVSEAKFSVETVAPRHRGVEFWLCRKL